MFALLLDPAVTGWLDVTLTSEGVAQSFVLFLAAPALTMIVNDALRGVGPIVSALESAALVLLTIMVCC
jgi:hypothetical protein